LIVPNIDALSEDDFRDVFSEFFAIKHGESLGRINTTPAPIQSLLANFWQIPIDPISSLVVYLRERNEANLYETGLLGFGPIENFQKAESASND